MKRPRLAIVIFFGLILVLLWWHWRDSKKIKRGAEEATTAATSDQPKALDSAAKDPQIFQDAQTVRTVAPRNAGATHREWDSAWSNEVNVPIAFYGKVVDENNNPVPGAQVQFSWDEVSAPFRTHNNQSATVSDTNGLFSLGGAHGTVLDVRVNKKGYYTPKPGFQGFAYSGESPFFPNAVNPVIFKLREKGEGVPVVQADIPGFAHILQLHHDGTPVELDLLKGTRVPTGQGQVKLEFWRDLSDQNAKVFDWKLQITIPGGGLLQTTDEFAFKAADSGYEPSLVIDMPKSQEGWQSKLNDKYYLRLSDGSYGRLDLDFLADNGVLRIHSVVNQDGTRNLEPR